MNKKTQLDKKPISFENSMDLLEQTVEKIEGGELSLDESIKEFEKGVRLIQNCQDHLAKAEQKVESLLQEKVNSE